MGSIFNFLNCGQCCLSDNMSNNKLLKISLANGDLWFPVPYKYFDYLNNFGSGFKWSSKSLSNKAYIYITAYFTIQWTYVAFRGKSFRVRNFCRNNKFTFNFGYSHWTKLMLAPNWAFFKRRRQRYIVYTKLLKDFLFFSRFLPNIRKYNCYTMRGLRLRKQAIIRRFGKISQHISILH